jgi:hypothetical protein
VLTIADADPGVPHDPTLESPNASRHLVIGLDLEQVGFSGLATKPGKVCVGHPPHPAYAAVNLAFQAGQTAVEIHGASPGLQDRMRPDLNRVKDKITVTFA